MKINYLISFSVFFFVFHSLQAQQAKEDFDIFLFKFASDKNFQLTRTQFPLSYLTWKNSDIVGGETITRMIQKKDWKHEPFFINENYRPQIYDNFNATLQDTDERLFRWIGVETGADVRFYFRRIKGKWYLVKKENLGD